VPTAGKRSRGEAVPGSQAVTVVGSRTLTGDGWTLTAERPAQPAPYSREPGAWAAVLGVRRDLKVLVTGDGRDRRVRVEAWAGEPGEDTDGVAVVRTKGGEIALARILLCGCGDRGCGNSYCQLDKELAADDLPALLAELRELPWAAPVPPPVACDLALRGDGLLALPERDSGRVSPGSVLITRDVSGAYQQWLIPADAGDTDLGDIDLGDTDGDGVDQADDGS
jgi:hypothetical protein